MKRDRQNGEPVDILLVEPNVGGAKRVMESFEDADIRNSTHVVSTGEEALDFVHQRGDYSDAPQPNLILLDIQLPDGSGHEVLSTLKRTTDFRKIPIIVLTCSDAEEDVIRSYNLHANAYIRKPEESEEFTDLIRTLEGFWLSAVKLPPSE